MILDFDSNPSQPLLSLLPDTRELRKQVTPPRDHVFVLRRSREYFLRFVGGRAVTVYSVGRSRQFDSLVLAVTHGMFWLNQSQAEHGAEICVEIYRPVTRIEPPMRNTDYGAAIRRRLGKLL